MGGRRSHTKSRNGCTQCKRRRIKCDEQSPQCSNCARRQTECDFMLRLPPESSSASSVGASGQLPSTDDPESSFVPSDSPPIKNLTLITPTGLHVNDLELLHHYTTVTYKTLPSGTILDPPYLWQNQVIQLGFRHEFLLRGILAVSALHLCHLHPNRREFHAVRASTHRSIALGAFRDTLTRVNESNCVAISAFSYIIIVLASASPRTSDDTSFQKDIVDWFHLTRGCNLALQAQWDVLSRSFLAPLLSKGLAHETAMSHKVQDCCHLTDLLLLCKSDRLERETATAYALAIQELLNSYTQVSIVMDHKQDLVPLIFAWPDVIPQHYLDMLRDRQPEAMIILAYYAVLLLQAEDRWFVQGWAQYLVTQIDAALGQEWHEWLIWPKKMITDQSPALSSNP